jgi:2-succinyl-5-enolpyruvyl-6-hydroxy-3-cyclohexene-1-carboxylate synthase
MELTGRENVNLYSIADERSAAFVALGMYLKTKRAVAVLCTSGSALLNYAPAAAEAYYQGIPLFIISADRPEIWLDQGEGQTINQRKALQNFINDEINIELDSEDSNYADLDAAISTVVDSAFYPSLGPVHINIEYDEPLYTSIETIDLTSVKCIDTRKQVSPSVDISVYADQIGKSKKVLVLCGQLLPDAELNSSLEKFAKNPQVVVLTESTSNLNSLSFIPSVDKTLLMFEKKFEEYKPDILITIGDAVISKIVKRVLRNHSPNAHWQINSSGVFRDTYKCLSDRIQMEPLSFFDQLSEFELNTSSDYSKSWMEKYQRANSLYMEFRKDIGFTDFFVFDHILNFIEKGSEVHVANSSPIRYQQLFENKGHLTYCNRGTSGIDGCSSTALGFSLKNEKPTWLLTGDVSFFYDSNAWWNSYKSQLKIVLINNGGGGIFRIIPGPMKVKDFETYFETPNKVNIKLLCEAYGINYFLADGEASLIKGCESLSKSEGISLLEIKTDREKNAVVLNDYFNILRAEDR